MSAQPDSRGPVRVLHVISGLNVGGTESTLVKLLRAWSASGAVASSVVSLRGGGALRSEITALAVPVASAELGGGVPHPRALARVAGRVRAFRPHVVQGWLVHGNVAALALGRVAPRVSGRPVPVLWGVRAGLADLGNEPRATRLVLRASVRLAGATTRVLYNAVRSAEEHEAIGYPVDRRVVIPNGFDVQQFRPDAAAHAELRREWGWPADAIVVGLVARDHPQKDLPTFFRAAGLAARAHPGLRFVVAGDGLDTGNPHLATLAGEAELGDKIRLLGTRRDVTRLFAAFDVATLCSRTEAFPNVLGEAMACGVVPVATDVGDVRALVGETGAVVPVGSASELAAGWIRHTERPAPERRRAGEAARARIVSDFALPRVAERYAGLYREVRPC